MTDVEFFFDPVCPWAWITSRWVEEVAAQRDLHVDWRFICLRIVNKEKDYRSDFPERYIAGHGTGQKLLRVAAAIRESEGARRWGRTTHGSAPTCTSTAVVTRSPGSGKTGSPTTSPRSACPPSWPGRPTTSSGTRCSKQRPKRRSQRVGRDVGTPIITFGGDARASFFGPVISRIPRGEEAVQLWDAVELVATTPGMAELKRSLRERPQTS